MSGSAEGVVRPIGLAVSPDGPLYVTDRRGRIVEMTPMGVIRTLAGSVPGFADGDGRDGALPRADGPGNCDLMARSWRPTRATG